MNLSKKINKFIVCLTVGYTITGTMDDVEKICELLRECKKKEEIDFFIHIDAAIGALIYKLCSKKIFDFSIPEVQTIVLDFHKMGRVPYSAGVFLCRHGLQNHIDRYVSYIGSHSDDTIIGSRGGAPAAACWAVWKTLGKQGFTQMFNTCLRKKAYFLRALKKKIKNIELLDFSPINMFAINFSSLTNSSLPNNIEHHYRIVSSLLPNIQNNKSLNVYKIYIMPHLRYQTIDKFIKDVSNLIYDKNSR